MTRCKGRRGRDDVGSELSAAGGRYSERVAAVKISSVRRKAARKFWAPQQDHRPLRVRGKECLRRDDVGIVPYGVRGKECLQDGAAGHMGPTLQAQILYLFMCKTNKKYRSL